MDTSANHQRIISFSGPFFFAVSQSRPLGRPFGFESRNQLVVFALSERGLFLLFTSLKDLPDGEQHTALLALLKPLSLGCSTTSFDLK